MKSLISALFFAILFSACNPIAEQPYHIQRLANAPVIETAICGTLTKAAFNENIPTHEGKEVITYNLLPIPEHLDTNYISRNIEHAFLQWAEIINIPIRRAQDIEADIHIEFDWLDGIGGILGIADFPGYKNPQIVTFDIYDISTIGEQHNYDFFTIALHEIGHTLGLPHLNSPEAVMWPAYRQHFRSPGAPDHFTAKDRYNITEPFIDKHNRKFIYIKKKTTQDYMLTSGETNSSPNVMISKEKGIG